MATTVPAASPAEALGRDYADRLILTAISELGGVARVSDIAEHLPGSGLDATTIHTLMATNPTRFAYHDRRWSAAIGTPEPNTAVATAALGLIRGYGAPMSVAQLAIELGNHYNRIPEHFEEMLPRLVKSDPNLLLSSDNHVGLAEWLFIPEGWNDDDNLFYNNLTRGEIDAVKDAAKGINWKKDDAPLLFLRKVGQPVRSTIIGYFACQALNAPDPYEPQLYDPVEVFNTVNNSGEFIFGTDGLWHPATDTKDWLKAAGKLAHKLEPSVEIEDTPPLEVKSAEIDKMVKIILGKVTATRATDLLKQMYDVGLGDRSYPEDLRTVTDGLEARDEILWVGGELFRKPGSEPPYVHEVPEALQYEEHKFLDDDGEIIDLELTVEAFSSSLRKELGHALVQDVLDDEPGPVHKHLSDEVRCVVKAHHKELGTFPLAQIPNGWLPLDPELQELVLEDTKGRELSVWVNLDIRLMFGMLNWYMEQEIESGSVFVLHKTDSPSRLMFRWAEEPDPLCFISSQRMEDLRILQERVDEMSTFEILTEIMSHYNKGADLITIVTECNVVRRARRNLIASILTGYHCFYQRAGSPVWHYDAKKVVQGADKSKRKYAVKK